MSKTCTFTHPIAARNGIKDKNNLMEKELDWSEDETYNEVYNRKLKYED